MTEKDAYKYQAGTLQQTKYGLVEGIHDRQGGTLAWLRVPYARPPLGELRWKAPRSLPAWKGIRQAIQFNNKGIQRAGEEVFGSEDCLYLNIWRPDTAEGGLPVLVWAHGGGNLAGSAEDFQGDRLAADANCIVVSVNYRLGMMGWFRYKGLRTGDPWDDSGNYGLLDIFQALSWVKDNALSFGGDPQNITLGGHSAGARNVLTALISPPARGLFQKLLIISGGRTLCEPQEAEDFALGIIGKLLVKDKVSATEEGARRYLALTSPKKIAAYLREKRAEDYLEFLGNVEIRMADFPHLFKDGQVIPADGFDLLGRGEYCRVPVILGCDATEYAIYNVLDAYWENSVLDLGIVNEVEKKKLYLQTLDYGSRLFACLNADSTADLLTDDWKQPPVYVYRLGWGTQEGTLQDPLRELVGASHQVDLDFLTGYENYILNKIFPTMCYTPANKPGREKLTSLSMAYLGNFLRSGNPNGQGLAQWQPWNCSKQEMKPMKAIRLDADAENAWAAMSADYYRKEEILKEMLETLAPQDLKIITGILLKGRFFMEY